MPIVQNEQFRFGDRFISIELQFGRFKVEFHPRRMLSVDQLLAFLELYNLKKMKIANFAVFEFNHVILVSEIEFFIENRTH